MGEAEPGYGYGGYSHVYRTTEGLTEGYYGKRSAEPGYGYSSGVSYYHRSPQGVQGYGYGGYHKRSAEPGYGYSSGISYYQKSPGSSRIWLWRLSQEIC